MIEFGMMKRSLRSGGLRTKQSGDSTAPDTDNAAACAVKGKQAGRRRPAGGLLCCGFKIYLGCDFKIYSGNEGNSGPSPLTHVVKGPISCAGAALKAPPAKRPAQPQVLSAAGPPEGTHPAALPSA